MLPLYARIGVCSFALVFLLFPQFIGDLPVFENPQPEISTEIAPKQAQSAYTLLFVGDLFLGRAVERLTEIHGDQYPFLKTAELIQDVDVAIGNFEGSVPEVHVPTPSMGFRFSIHERFMPVLETVGFDVLSLANNHAYDYGLSGFVHTQTVCAQTSIRCTGHPHNNPQYATTSIVVGTTSIGILSLHALVPIEQSTLTTLSESTAHNDLRIAYIHWGNEYEHTHSTYQKTIAHTLIDSGIDAVIGHHPHVVQDIEIYHDRPIFYSLGNFVFDQYFSDAVMHGIGIILTIREETLQYDIIPFESASIRSQPHILENAARDSFVSQLTYTGLGTSTLISPGSLSFPRE